MNYVRQYFLWWFGLNIIYAFFLYLYKLTSSHSVLYVCFHNRKD
jgi:hypothetical protein